MSTSAPTLPFCPDEVLRRVGLWRQALLRSLDNHALHVACPTCRVVPGCPCAADDDRLLPRHRLHQSRARLAWSTRLEAL